VTGKGGTGKTTVAAALGLALAASGGRVLLCESEGRQGLARIFDVPPLPYEERQIAVAPGGGDLFALAIDGEAALLEYLEMYYKLGRAGRALDRFGVIDFATTIAPGLRDVLLTGKVYEATQRRTGRGRGRDSAGFAYDAVVLDAPPTGRITRFLNVNEEVAGLAKVGPIRKQADSIMSLLRSPETVVHIVTVLEDMPVQEAGDGIAALQGVDLPVGGVVVNLARRARLGEDARDAAVAETIPDSGVSQGLRAAGIEPSDTLLDGLMAEALEHAQRLALEDEQRTLVEKLQRPTFELPRLPEGVDLGGLYELAAELREQGMV
jgi:anion-transporting  ArsA/GET3 family ATPase